VVNAAGLGPNIFASTKFLAVDHQLAVKQVHLFDTCMAMGRIVCSRGEPHEHGNAVRL
jgi:hypothetical protein